TRAPRAAADEAAAQVPAIVRRSGAGDDLELDATVEDVEAVVAAAADDVLAKAHSFGTGPTGELGRLAREPLADVLGALQRQRVVDRPRAAAAGVADDRDAALGRHRLAR